ncbi:hypothetical protein NDU88_009533 [Pleurodeles waltl]|uniref:Uncharacterized protein n=1 Tax=Pleurodeles waltl TaxID=8319 RepID=A0AAV7RVI0_PLEWA|nr:hypothetical protein NDU88_009533 [Pleurodeles waltl]
MGRHDQNQPVSFEMKTPSNRTGVSEWEDLPDAVPGDVDPDPHMQTLLTDGKQSIHTIGSKIDILTSRVDHMSCKLGKNSGLVDQPERRDSEAEDDSRYQNEQLLRL